MAGLRFMSPEQMTSFDGEHLFDFGLDFNRYLLQHPSASFVMRVSGQRHRCLGVYDGDLLIVDRAVVPQANNLIVINLESELQLCRFGERKLNLELDLWGVVVQLLRKMR
ncbi:MAG: hypothetical protein OXU45_02555 [Candidatus Melainabacteria bacterium]|nr:hypothetical protein [Candidatus Melainabacteria bacterium]